LLQVAYQLEALKVIGEFCEEDRGAVSYNVARNCAHVAQQILSFGMFSFFVIVA